MVRRTSPFRASPRKDMRPTACEHGHKPEHSVITPALQRPLGTALAFGKPGDKSARKPGYELDHKPDHDPNVGLAREYDTRRERDHETSHSVLRRFLTGPWGPSWPSPSQPSRSRGARAGARIRPERQCKQELVPEPRSDALREPPRRT